jgi:hypothetical protein
LIVPLPDPEVVTVHHDWLLLAVHEEFEVTENDVEPASGETVWFEGVTERVGVEVPEMETSSTQTPRPYLAFPSKAM